MDLLSPQELPDFSDKVLGRLEERQRGTVVENARPPAPGKRLAVQAGLPVAAGGALQSPSQNTAGTVVRR